MIAARLASFYGIQFFVIGVMLPFWPLWLQGRGLTPADIGIVMAVGMVMKIAANPVVAAFADRTGERRRPMIALAAAACLAFAAFRWADGFLTVTAVSMLFFMFWSPKMPLIETLTMQFRDSGLNYGRVRLWGSLTFIAASWGGGWVLTGRDTELIYWIILGGAVAVVVAAWMLPDGQRRAPAAAGRSFGPILAVFKDRTFVWFMIGSGLIQTSHIIYYAFGTIHWRAVGHSEAVIGWLWAEGVIAEVFLFMWGDRIVGRIGAARLIALAGLAGLVRWWGTGVTDALPALIVLQLLHGATFGAAHLGAIHFIARRMDASVSATAQSVYSAVVTGIGFSLASLFSGHLYAASGGGAYIAMAAMAGLGGIIAFHLRRR